MFRVAICDDNERITISLAETVRGYCQKKDILAEVAEYLCAEALYEKLYKGEHYDLIFIDIEFPGKCDGVAIGQLIRNQLLDDAVQLVYISGRENYYKELLELRPMHFLLKPFTDEKVEADIAKAVELNGIQKRLFTYQKGKEKRRILLREVLYFESVGRQVCMHCISGDEMFYGKMKDVAKQLEGSRFCMPNRSFLVRYDCIVKFTSQYIVLENGRQISITKKYEEKMMERQMEYEKRY